MYINWPNLHVFNNQTSFLPSQKFETPSRSDENVNLRTSQSDNTHKVTEPRSSDLLVWEQVSDLWSGEKLPPNLILYNTDSDLIFWFNEDNFTVQPLSWTGSDRPASNVCL